MSRVSVVIPLYNKRETVRQSVDSVLRQDYDDWDLIVVDDGSTDNGADLLRDILDKRLRVIRQENRGLSVARNAGIEASSSDVVALLDADDLWDADHLSTLMALMDSFPSAGLVGTRYRILREGGAVSLPDYADGALPEEDGIVANYFRAATLGSPPFMPSCVGLRRRALERVGGFRGRYGEDSDMWIRMVGLGPVALSSRTTMSYRLYLDDPSSTGRAKRSIDDLSSPHFSAWPSLTGQGDPWLDEYVALKQIQQLTYYALAGLGSVVREQLREVRTRRFVVAKRVLWLKTWLAPGWILAVSRLKRSMLGLLGRRR